VKSTIQLQKIFLAIFNLTVNFAYHTYPMGRIMAIDFGTVRMGIAVTDPLKIIANGLDTIAAKNIIPFLDDYFKKQEVDCMVVGTPASNGRGGEIAKLAAAFCEKIKLKFPSLKIDRIDEFYTSKLAERTILQSGINKTARRDKSLVDKISATIILQNYLDRI
jgi:putative holliday junction resolvase